METTKKFVEHYNLYLLYCDFLDSKSIEMSKNLPKRLCIYIEELARYKYYIE